MTSGRLVLALGGCLLAGSAGFFVTSAGKPQSNDQVAMRPFTAQIIEKHFGPDGKLTSLMGAVNYITIGRKSDGSYVRFLPIQGPDGSYEVLRDIFDASGKQISIHPHMKSITTYFISPIHAGHELARETCPPEAGNPTAERSQRLDYEVVRLREDTQTKLGVETDDRWVAPALGCFTMEETYITESGSRNEDTVVSIMEGEPAESWFTLPSGYTEMSPSEVASAFAARFPGHKFVPDEAAKWMDKGYYAHRTPQQ